SGADFRRYRAILRERERALPRRLVPQPCEEPDATNIRGRVLPPLEQLSRQRWREPLERRAISGRGVLTQALFEGGQHGLACSQRNAPQKGRARLQRSV